MRFSTVGLMDALDRYRPRHGGVCRGRGQGKTAGGWSAVAGGKGYGRAHCWAFGRWWWGMWTFRAGVLHAESRVPSIPMPIATPTPKVGFDVLWVGFFVIQVFTADGAEGPLCSVSGGAFSGARRMPILIRPRRSGLPLPVCCSLFDTPGRRPEGFRSFGRLWMGLAHGGASLDRYLHASAVMVNVLIGIMKVAVSLDCGRLWW